MKVVNESIASLVVASDAVDATVVSLVETALSDVNVSRPELSLEVGDVTTAVAEPLCLSSVTMVTSDDVLNVRGSSLSV